MGRFLCGSGLLLLLQNALAFVVLRIMTARYLISWRIRPYRYYTRDLGNAMYQSLLVCNWFTSTRFLLGSSLLVIDLGLSIISSCLRLQVITSAMDKVLS